MIKINEYNKISPQLEKKLIRMLKPGEVVEVELIAEQDPENPGVKLMPSVESISVKSVIFDEFANSYVNVAYIAGQSAEGSAPSFGIIKFEKRNNGIIRLRGGNSDDQNMFEYMCLTDANESKPNRNKDVRPVFRIVDKEKIAREANERAKLQTEARAIVVAMSNEDILKFSSARNWNETSPDIIRQRMYQMAESNPEGFMSTGAVSSTQSEIKEKFMAVAQAAIDRKVVVWNRESRWLQFHVKNGEEEFTIDVVQANQADKKPQVLAAFFEDAKNEVLFDKIAAAVGL